MRNRQQCGAARPYAFVVHGLWPQFERGYPENCATDEPDVSNATLRTLYDLTPSAGLIRYEWRKHGSCSGLAQADYFSVLRAARDRISHSRRNTFVWTTTRRRPRPKSRQRSSRPTKSLRRRTWP